MAAQEQPLAPPESQPDESTELRVGSFRTVFAERDPRSPVEAQNRRYHVPTDGLQRYELNDHSFEVYVPENYDPQKHYGVIAWISAGGRGGMPRGWREVMDRHRMIFIGANDSGNEKGIAVRMGLAMDGVANLRKLYTIDEARVYAAGNSGGGKIASMLTVLYPELFVGAIPIVGVTYYRAIPLRNDSKRGWLPSYLPPPAATLNRAKEFSRIVLITGSEDSNRDSIYDTYDRGFLPDGFKFVEYVEVEGMGHTLPPPQYIDRALEMLDKPLPQLCARMLELGQGLQRGGKREEAESLYRAVVLHGDERVASRAQELIDRLGPSIGSVAKTSASPSPAAPATRPMGIVRSRAEEAGAMLSLAENYERNLMYIQARQRAEQIVRDYSDTPAAEKAKAMIVRINSRR